jgi:hypothetical protein
VLRFVRIEFSGVVIGEANELNILTQNSLGRLSQLDHVQTNRGLDDCFEWFGGNVRGKFLVATACGDDGLDWQIGYQGQPDPAAPQAAIQFALVTHDSASVASTRRARHRGDNSEFGAALQPRSAPWLCNITAVGTRDTGGPQTTPATARVSAAARPAVSRTRSSRTGARTASTSATRARSTSRRRAPFNDGATPCTGSATECADAT